MPFEGLPPQRPTYKRLPHVDPALPASERIARTKALNEERLRKGAAYRAKIAENAQRAPLRLAQLRESLLGRDGSKRKAAQEDHEGPELSYGDLVDVDAPSTDRMDRYDQLRAERIKNESDQLAKGAETRFRNKMMAKHRFAPSLEAERELWEAADEAPAFPNLSEYEFPNWASVPASKQNVDESLDLTDADLTELSPRELARYERDQELAREVAAFQKDLKKPRAIPPSLEKKFATKQEMDAARSEREQRERKPRATPPSLEKRFATKQEMDAARSEREQRERGVNLDKNSGGDLQRVQISDLKAKQEALLEYPRVQVQRINAKAESIADTFEAKTGVPIEAYLAGTLETFDRLRISAQNIGSALSRPFRFVQGIFSGGRPTGDIVEELSPQAILEQYEHTRTQAEEAQAALVSAEVNAQRIQDQIDQLEMTSADYRAKKDADWDRAEHAKNLGTLGRSGGGAAGLFRSDRSQPRGREAVVAETTDESQWDSSAPRISHRDLSYNFNPLTSSPSLRKLAPLYAKPGPSRTNGMKGYEDYDNVMDIPGFAERYNTLSDEEEAPDTQAISPEAAPWRDGGSIDTREEAQTMLDKAMDEARLSIERNINVVDTKIASEIADEAFELLLGDIGSQDEGAIRLDRLGRYMPFLPSIEQDLIGERPTAELYRALVRPETHRALRQLIVDSLKKLRLPSTEHASEGTLNNIASLLLVTLQAKATILLKQQQNNPPTFVRSAENNLDDGPEVSLSDREFNPEDFSDLLDEIDKES